MTSLITQDSLCSEEPIPKEINQSPLTFYVASVDVGLQNDFFFFLHLGFVGQ